MYVFLVFLLSFSQFISQPEPADLPSLPPPQFGTSSGFYDEPFVLVIASMLPDVEIWYTLDGREPIFQGRPTPTARLFTPESQVAVHPDSISHPRIADIPTSPIFAEPYFFQWLEPVEYGPRAVIVRAALLDAAGNSSPVVNATFFIGTPVPELPVISLILPPEYLFDEESGIYVPGLLFDSDPISSTAEWQSANANYHMRGDEWERQSSFEYFVDAQSVLHQDVGLRIHGGGSRVLPMKSLRVYARSSYGKSSIDYPFFGSGNDKSFDRLILRNSGQDFYHYGTMMRDALIHRLSGVLRFETMDYQPAIVFINGEYWGLHNIRERFDDNYFDRRYNIDSEDLEFLTTDGGASLGIINHFTELTDYIRTHNPADSIHYAHIGAQMDIENFIDYQIAQIYVANGDWPGWNQDFFRYAGPAPTAGTVKDGRWRWVMYDTDAGFLEPDANWLEFASSNDPQGWPNPEWSTLIFRRLLENNTFRLEFLRRFNTLLETRFQPSAVSALIDSMSAVISPEIERHIERWNYPLSIWTWRRDVASLHTFAEKRYEIMREHLQEFFDLQDPGFVSVEVSGNAGKSLKTIRINDLEARLEQPQENGPETAWEGWVFSESGELTLTVQPHEGYQLSGWQINGKTFDVVDKSEGNTIAGKNSFGQYITFQPYASDTVKIIVHLTEITEQLYRDWVHFWFFDDQIPNNTPLLYLDPAFSAVPGALITYHPALENAGQYGETAGIMDRVNDPITINLPEQLVEAGIINPNLMRGVRVRNPAVVEDADGRRESALVLHLPTTGYANPQLSFVANRTSNGPDYLIFDYSVSAGEPEWQTVPHFEDYLTWSSGVFTPGLAALNEEEYRLYTIDFGSVPDADDNEFFKLRVRFAGSSVFGLSGNVRLNNIGLSGNVVTSLPRNEEQPRIAGLMPAYPNPFNPVTTIPFRLDEATSTRLVVYNILGERVATLVDEIRSAGEHRVVFNAHGLASGVYVLSLTAGAIHESRKILLIR